MIAEAMVDTNVLIYAASSLSEDATKAVVAQNLLFNHSIGLSAQVLQEFVVVSTKKKVRKAWTYAEASEWVKALEELPCVDIDASLVRSGAEIASRYQISYWDGAILAAAHRLSADILYSEDLNHGQIYGSVRVVNPFLQT